MARLLLYLFNLIFVTVIGWILARVIQRLFGPTRLFPGGTGSATTRRGSERTVRGETARDPVCGMFVSTELSHRLTRGAETLHFCSRECLERYQADAQES